MHQEPLKLQDELSYSQEFEKKYQLDNEWWKLYGDENLNKLVETALTNNPDYLKAAQNINKQLYSLSLATSDLFPTVYAGLDASSQRKIYTGDDFGDNFSGDLGLNYEIDLYGKIRNEREAQRLEYEATVMDKESARLSLINSVVDLYFNLGYLQNSIDLTKKNIKAYEGIRKVAEQKYINGKTDNLDLLQSTQSLLSEQNKLLELETQFKEQKTALQNILNESKDTKIVFADVLKQKSVAPDLDVPVAVLANRPDLLSAQYRLEKAFENLKAENKNWYPNISINGALQSSSDKARTTFDFSYVVGSVSVDLPFLDWNRVKNNIKISEADYQISLIDFKDTLNQALNEISYYSYAYKQSESIYKNVEKNYQNSKKIAVYYRNRYEAGKDDIKDWLGAINTENSLLKSLIEQKYQIIKYENYLYKAMGGRYKKVSDK